MAWFLPAYNEADNLPLVVNEIHSYLKSLGCRFTIIIVNDGSSDNSADVVERLSADYPAIRVINHPKNRGYGAALRTGLQEALNTGHQLIGFCDADGQFSIDSLAPMLEAIKRADAVLGVRAKRADNLKRRLMGRGWHYVSSVMLNYHAQDVDCGFKLFRRKLVLEVLPRLNGEYATISPEIIARAEHGGFTIAESLVEHHPRQLGKQTGSNLRVVIGSFVSLWQLRQLLRKEV